MDRKIWPYADERLILRVGQGDLLALQQLYDQTAETVYCYALAVSGGTTAAQFITEQTYYSIWKNAGDYHIEEYDAIPWILAVCDRVATDQVKFNRRTKGENPFSVEEGCPIATRFLNLPLRDRKLLALYGMLGLGLREVASVSKQFINLVPVVVTESYLRISRASTLFRTPKELNQEMRREFLSVIPEMDPGFLNACAEIVQTPNHSGKILKSSRLQPARMALTAVLVIAALGVGTVIHLVNENDSLVTVTTESGRSMAVNAMDRVKVVVTEDGEDSSDSNANNLQGVTLTQVMGTMTKEELDNENLTTDNNSVLITVQEDDMKRADELSSETKDTVNSIADEYGISPAILIQILPEETLDTAGKEALVTTLKDVLEDCADQGIEELSVQDLAYLYYHRGLDLDSISLHGTPSEEKYQKGQETANQIFANLNSDDTWVDIFLTVWNNQLVYQVTVFQEDLQNIYEVNAETGDIISVRILRNDEVEETTPAPDETSVPTPTQIQTPSRNSGSSGSSGSSGGNTVDRIVRDITSSADPSVKVSRVIRDATGGKIDLNLDLPGGW